MTPKKVFVSGCYDLLHSGHVEFFRQAAQYGDLYVGIGSDETILHYKKHRTVYPERERLFMVKAIRYVKDAFINAGDGVMDFVPTVEQLRPDIFVVNEDGASDEKEALCRRMGMEYIVLPRTPSVYCVAAYPIGRIDRPFQHRPEETDLFHTHATGFGRYLD